MSYPHPVSAPLPSSSAYLLARARVLREQGDVAHMLATESRARAEDAVHRTCGLGESHLRERAAELDALARSRHVRATACDADAKAAMTRFERARPMIKNVIVGSVVAAELVGIPLMIADIELMLHRKPSAGGASP